MSDGQASKEDNGKPGQRVRKLVLGALLITSLAVFAVYHVSTLLAPAGPAESLPAQRPEPMPPPEATEELLEAIARLEAIGYLSAEEPVPDNVGVLVYDESRACAGLNLCCSAYTEAILMDLEGNDVHKWQCSFVRAFPGQPAPPAKLTEATSWRHVRLLDDGGLLSIHESLALVRLDKDSNVIWGNIGFYHHDLDVLDDGTILALVGKIEVLPRFNETEPILHDFVCVLDPEGNETARYSILEMFENSPYESILAAVPGEGDVMHTNTCRYIDGSLAHLSPIFQEGNVLISMRELDTVAIVDLEVKTVVWAKQGPWKRQHMPNLLENGHILIFDNSGLGERSRVVEYDPLADAIVWGYGEEPVEEFYTDTCGYSQRLPNGNTLITETAKGRAFEVTPDKEVVWEYINKYPYQHAPELVGVLWSAVRVDPAFVQSWIGGEEAPQP